jgi:hypothetical protein
MIRLKTEFHIKKESAIPTSYADISFDFTQDNLNEDEDLYEFNSPASKSKDAKEKEKERLDNTGTERTSTGKQAVKKITNSNYGHLRCPCFQHASTSSDADEFNLFGLNNNTMRNSLEASFAALGTISVGASRQQASNY